MSKDKVSEDLFEDTKMSFGEHIEELRVVFIRALIGIGIATVLGFMLSHHVVNFLQVPLKQAIEDFRLKRAAEKFEKSGTPIPLAVEQKMETDRLLPQRLLVEPHVFARTMQDAFPGMKISQPESLIGFTPSQFDLSLLPTLAESIVNASENTPQSAIRTMLSQPELESLTEIAAASDGTSTNAETVAKIFNELLEQPEKFNNESFVSITGAMGNENLVMMTKFLDKLKDSEDPTEAKLFRRSQKSFHHRLLLESMPRNAISENEMVALTVWKEMEVKSQALGTQEPFMIWLKASIFTGMAIASPWIFLQVWLFVAAGLYPHEKKYVYLYLPFSIILFVGGALFAFYVVFKFVLDFLFSFNAQMGIDPDPRINEYLGFVMMLPLGFGIAFQLPLVMLFVHRIGLVSIETYLHHWRIAVVIICVISMLCTPTDPISMILMAIPLLFLYFGGIGLCKWMPKGRNPFEGAFDPT